MSHLSKSLPLLFFCFFAIKWGDYPLAGERKVVGNMCRTFLLLVAIGHILYMVAIFQDGLQWSRLLVVTPLCGVQQGWSTWPIGCHRSEGQPLPKVRRGVAASLSDSLSPLALSKASSWAALWSCPCGKDLKPAADQPCERPWKQALHTQSGLRWQQPQLTPGVQACEDPETVPPS